MLGQGRLQAELEKRMAKDSEAIVFEQEAKKFFLAWRQVGARREEQGKVCSLCWPLFLDSQHWAAVANGSRLYAKKTNPHLPRIRSTFHPHATQTVPNFVPTSRMGGVGVEEVHRGYVWR